jgi:predicted nucleotidyltransferase
MTERDMALKNLIYKIRIGSQMYGTVTPESDEDYAGIFIPNKNYIMGIHKVEQVILSEKKSTTIRNQQGDIDYTIYTLPKFVMLCIANNPNIIEYLYAPKNCIMTTSYWSNELVLHRDLFLSKKAYHTFKGYAYSQRRKLEIKKENMTGRVELAEKFGYDTKFASHLIRLLLECQQILVEKQLTFPLPQNNLVRDIKLGKYSLDWVINKANELEKLIDLAYTTSDLQHKANIPEINDLQIRLIEYYWQSLKEV